LKLNKNIKKDENGRNSYVVPRVYEGKRSSLGKGTNEFKLDKSDYSLINSVFSNSKRVVLSKHNDFKNKK